MTAGNTLLLVSACLVGVPCRYNGGSCPDPRLLRLLREGRLLPVCPEQLGGLTTPRRPVELAGGDGEAFWEGGARALTQEGRDVSAALRRGAEAVLDLARNAGIRGAVLKDGSPSCGSTRVRDGSFSSTWVPGRGVTAALLKRHGVPVYSAEDWRYEEESFAK